MRFFNVSFGDRHFSFSGRSFACLHCFFGALNSADAITEQRTGPRYRCGTRCQGRRKPANAHESAFEDGILRPERLVFVSRNVVLQISVYHGSDPNTFCIARPATNWVLVLEGGSHR